MRGLWVSFRSHSVPCQLRNGSRSGTRSKGMWCLRPRDTEVKFRVWLRTLTNDVICDTHSFLIKSQVSGLWENTQASYNDV